jgi:hypothetical protein
MGKFTVLKNSEKYCNSESSELLNFFSKTYEKFSIFYWNKQRINKFYWKFNISYLKILSNSEDSQLQAKNTGYSVKNWKFVNEKIFYW